MAQSDIHYSNSMHEEQDTGNPDPIKMFKSLMSNGRNQGHKSGGRVDPSDNDEENTYDDGTEMDDLELGKSGAKSSSSAQQPLPTLAEMGLKPNNTLRVLQERSQNMTPEEREAAEKQAAQMQELLNAKLAKMPADQRAQLQARQKAMTQAVMAQLHEDTVNKAIANGVQPKLMPAAAGAVAQNVAQPQETPEQTRDREILFAIRSGNIESLKELLAKYNMSVNGSVKAPNDAEAHPLLHWASLNDQKEVLEYLVSVSVDLDQRNPRGEVALHWACLNGNLRSVHLLIDAGCDRMASDARGYSAMHHAAQFGRSIVLACLLRRGLNVDIRDNNGRTPLHWAAYKGEDRCAQWLLEHGADVSAQDFERCLPIHWAALQGLTSMSHVLLKYGAISHLTMKDRTGGTPAALAREKQARYEPTSHQHKTFLRVGDYLEACEKKGKDIRQKPVQLRHPTWYAWPVLATIGFWQYWTVVMEDTIYYPILTLVFWTSYWGCWLAWTMLQIKNPGTYVLRDEKSMKAFRAKYQASSSSSSSGAGKGQDNVLIAVLDDDGCACPINPAQRNAEKYRAMYLEVLDKGLLVPVCATCEIVKPIRSKHDKFTDVCIARFDHFCPFMGVAVGQNNYLEFFMTMVAAFVCIWSWLYMTILYTSALNPELPFYVNFWSVVYWEIFVWVAYLPLGIYATLMMGQHAMFIKRNITTNEVMNRYRYQYLANKQNPFNRGALGNILEFLGIMETREMDVRGFYNIEFEGRSPQVEDNNQRLRAGLAPRPPPSKGSCCSHSHSHGGHGHSH
mmetsp:Transcript_1626/g.3779  ORF Transcript_1626/g.3779 Transcript_1626/m.3779 type:complete len:791 (+) Transcript_1626:519-2891(+)